MTEMSDRHPRLFAFANALVGIEHLNECLRRGIEGEHFDLAAMRNMFVNDFDRVTNNDPAYRPLHEFLVEQVSVRYGVAA